MRKFEEAKKEAIYILEYWAKKIKNCNNSDELSLDLETMQSELEDIWV